MNRVYHPCSDWEDWQAGMYRLTSDKGSVAKSAKLLSSPARLLKAMRSVIVKWPSSAEHQLSNLERNRRSWLGQAACCLVAKSSESDTCIAWGSLTDRQRSIANAIADKVIAEWEASREIIATLFE